MLGNLTIIMGGCRWDSQRVFYSLLWEKNEYFHLSRRCLCNGGFFHSNACFLLAVLMKSHHGNFLSSSVATFFPFDLRKSARISNKKSLKFSQFSLAHFTEWILRSKRLKCSHLCGVFSLKLLLQISLAKFSQFSQFFLTKFLSQFETLSSRFDFTLVRRRKI